MFEVKNWKLSAALQRDTSLPKKSRDAKNTDSGPPNAKRRKIHIANGDKREAKIGNPAADHLWHVYYGGSDNTANPASSSRLDARAQEKTTTVRDDKHGAKGRFEDGTRTEGLLTERSRIAQAKATKKSAKSRKRKVAAGNGSSSASTGSEMKNADEKSDDVHHAIKSSKPDSVEPSLTPMQLKMAQKLASARFRHLNEQLYTKTSQHSFDAFTNDPSVFEDYHKGFAQQVAVWPENPVQSFVTDILARGKVRPRSGYSKGKRQDNRHPKKPPQKQEDGAIIIEPLPRTRGPPCECVIADLGCGTAGMAKALQPHLDRLGVRIHSFDLHAPDPLITTADIANLPLKDAEVDIAVFCLALMGTNWPDFIDEAWRALRPTGELWVAEIKSRFGPRVASHKTEGGTLSKRKMKRQNTKAGERLSKEEEEQRQHRALAVEVDGQQDRTAETDVSAFVAVLKRRGFSLLGEPDLGNKMFVKMKFRKDPALSGARDEDSHGRHNGMRKEKKRFIDADDLTPREDDASVLKPCVYKLR